MRRRESKRKEDKKKLEEYKLKKELGERFHTAGKYQFAVRYFMEALALLNAAYKQEEIDQLNYTIFRLELYFQLAADLSNTGHYTFSVILLTFLRESYQLKEAERLLLEPVGNRIIIDCKRCVLIAKNDAERKYQLAIYLDATSNVVKTSVDYSDSVKNPSSRRQLRRAFLTAIRQDPLFLIYSLIADKLQAVENIENKEQQDTNLPKIKILWQQDMAPILNDQYGAVFSELCFKYRQAFFRTATANRSASFWWGGDQVDSSLVQQSVSEQYEKARSSGTRIQSQESYLAAIDSSIEIFKIKREAIAISTKLMVKQLVNLGFSCLGAEFYLFTKILFKKVDSLSEKVELKEGHLSYIQQAKRKLSHALKKSDILPLNQMVEASIGSGGRIVFSFPPRFAALSQYKEKISIKNMGKKTVSAQSLMKALTQVIKFRGHILLRIAEKKFFNVTGLAQGKGSSRFEIDWDDLYSFIKENFGDVFLELYREYQKTLVSKMKSTAPVSTRASSSQRVFGQGGRRRAQARRGRVSTAGNPSDVVACCSTQPK